MRWDGYAPITGGDKVTPDVLAAAPEGHHRPERWDLVIQPTPGIPAEDYAAVGVTWLIHEVPVTDDLADTVHRVAAAGPAGAAHG